MQWDEKELDTKFNPNAYFWTPNSEILDKPVITHIQFMMSLALVCNTSSQLRMKGAISLSRLGSAQF